MPEPEQAPYPPLGTDASAKLDALADSLSALLLLTQALASEVAKIRVRLDGREVTVPPHEVPR